MKPTKPKTRATLAEADYDKLHAALGRVAAMELKAIQTVQEMARRVEAVKAQSDATCREIAGKYGLDPAAADYGWKDATREFYVVEPK